MDATLNVSYELPKFQVPISQPTTLADFSFDANKNFATGRGDFHHLVDTFECRYDLNVGMETTGVNVAKEKSEGLAHVLSCIENSSDPGATLSKAIHGADVVCRRGAITRLGASKGEIGGSGWKFAAVEFEGIMFVSELENDAVAARKLQPQTQWDKCTEYWGFKFEDYILKPKEQQRDADSTETKTYNSFRLDLPQTSQFDGMKLFYTAEVDGLDSDGNTIEVKTTKLFEPRYGNGSTAGRSAMDLFYKGKYFNSKVTKWYMQSKLANISTIVVGFRNNRGIVSRVEPFDIEQLRSSVRNCFDYDGCLEVAHYILSHVRSLLRANPGNAVVFERAPNSQDILFTTHDAEEFGLLNPEFTSRFGGK